MSSLELKIPPPIYFLILLVMIIVTSEFFPIKHFTFPWLDVAGIYIGGLGVAVGAGAVVQFLLAKTTIHPLEPEKASRLVTSGLNSFSRNPMYLGLALVLFGVFAQRPTLSGLILWVGFIFMITRFQILPEERVLEEKFGEDYKTYKAKVRRWI